jgi:arylsulfatase A-like enzyme
MMNAISTKRFALLLLLIIGAGLSSIRAADRAKRPNILFIMVDDLRAQLGCYGLDFMATPNLDRFAAESRVFNQQFVQAPSCGPSRCSLLTGRYPRRNEDLTNHATFSRRARLEGGSGESAIATLPEFFRHAGYQTVGLGKVGNSADGLYKGTLEFPEAWDRTWGPKGIWGTSQKAISGYANGKFRRAGVTPPTERGQVDDRGYPDGLIADEAIRELRAFDRSRPFFLAVGFFKPHLPFVAPAKYWDLYDPDKIPAPRNTRPPAGTQLGPNGELTQGYGGWRERGVISDEEAKLLRHAYAAAISYIDAQAGRVLEELDALGLAGDTIVVLWGDHGWHLGELGAWGKQTLMDWALRSTLIIRVPGQKLPGTATEAVVEAVDVYPTLAALCALEAPKELDGASIAELLESPEARLSRPALSWWYRGPGLTVNAVGRSIRTPDWRYTRWDGGQQELYDQIKDPDETTNLATDSAYEETMRRLREDMLRRAPAWENSEQAAREVGGDIDP